MDRKIIATAALFGMTAVIFGAFGAHALKKLLELDQLNTFETGVRYQMYHALLLLCVGLSNIRPLVKKRILYFLTAGIILFSGSIYLLATSTLTGIDFKIIGIVTPIGGLLLIIGWMLLFLEFVIKKNINKP